jgi:hypothetical protein
MDGILPISITIAILFLLIFFLECLGSDIVGTVVYAVPFFILFFVSMAIFGEFQSMFQAVISILAIVNTIMILGNLLKVVIL